MYTIYLYSIYIYIVSISIIIIYIYIRAYMRVRACNQGNKKGSQINDCLCMCVYDMQYLCTLYLYSIYIYTYAISYLIIYIYIYAYMRVRACKQGNKKGSQINDCLCMYDIYTSANSTYRAAPSMMP